MRNPERARPPTGAAANRRAGPPVVKPDRPRGRKPGLESSPPEADTPRMSTKQIVQDLLQKLPEDVSLHDIAQEIEFVAGVRQGLGEIERGERIPIEEIERELPSWVIR